MHMHAGQLQSMSAPLCTHQVDALATLRNVTRNTVFLCNYCLNFRFAQRAALQGSPAAPTVSVPPARASRLVLRAAQNGASTKTRLPKIADSITEVIGNTPLVHLSLGERPGNAAIAAKLEILEPCRSVKDRIGLNMIEDAERKGLIRAGEALSRPVFGACHLQGVGRSAAAVIMI